MSVRADSKPLLLILLLVFALLVSPVSAEIYRCTDSDGKQSFQEQPCPSTRLTKPTVTAPVLQTHNILWRAYSGDSTLYLLGSLPFGDSALFPLDSAIERAFEEADALAVQSSLLSAPQESIKEQLRHRIYLSSGERLDNHLSVRDRQQLRAVTEKFAIPLADVEILRPWYAAHLITQRAMQYAGYTESFALDNYLATKAMNGKPVLRLESAAEQIDLFSSLDMEQQKLLLLKTLDELARDIPYFDQLMSSWHKGDTLRLDNFLNSRFRSVPALSTLYRKLLVERNQKLTELADRMLGDRLTYLVIIDSAHLLGEDGVVTLLKRRGYQLDQL